MKSYVVFEDEVYLRGKEPIAKPTQVPDVIDSRVADQKFVIAGNAGLKASTQVMPGSNYGLDGQVMDTQVNVVKPAAVGIDNVDMKQIRHNGLGEGNLYTGVKGDEGAAE